MCGAYYLFSEEGRVIVRFGELGRESLLQAYLMRFLEEQGWEKGVPWVCSGSRFVFSILGSSGEWGNLCAHLFSAIKIVQGLKTQALEAGIAGSLQGPALSFASCVTLYKLLYFTKPWFLYLLNRDSNGTFPLGWVSDRMCGKHLAQCQAHGKLSDCLGLLWLFYYYVIIKFYNLIIEFSWRRRVFSLLQWIMGSCTSTPGFKVESHYFLCVFCLFDYLEDKSSSSFFSYPFSSPCNSSKNPLPNVDVTVSHIDVRGKW